MSSKHIKSNLSKMWDKEGRTHSQGKEIEKKIVEEKKQPINPVMPSSKIMKMKFMQHAAPITQKVSENVSMQSRSRASSSSGP